MESGRGEVKIKMSSERRPLAYTHTYAHTYTQTHVNELKHCKDIAMSEETYCVQFHLLLAENITEGLSINLSIITLPKWLTGYARSKTVGRCLC